MPNPHKPTGDLAKKAGLRAAHALLELVAHLVVLAGLLVCIKLLEKLMHKLWDKDYLFFNKLKLRYVFDGADLVILVVFLAWGVYLAITAYIREPD